MGKIPDYPPTAGSLDGSELLLGFAQGLTRRITVDQISAEADLAGKPLRADGSRAALASLPMGGNRVVDVGDPVDDTDAVNKRAMTAYFAAALAAMWAALPDEANGDPIPASGPYRSGGVLKIA